MSCRNIFRLLAWREISHRTKQSSKSLWGETPKWVETESLRHLSVKHCSPMLAPLLTAAFSSDGKTLALTQYVEVLASTRDSPIVKIIDCHTGNCLKELSGHLVTPWVVKYHPLYPEILASGSVDHEVRVWNANTGDCIESHDFYHPIASIAFHAQGELLAVAAGCMLYIWNYSQSGEAPTIVLTTRHPLKAVHFHPHAAPYVLTAEASDLGSPDYPLTLAISPGYLQYSPPPVFLTNIHSTADRHSGNEMALVPHICFFWPTFARKEERTSLQHESRLSGLDVEQQGSEPSLSNQRETYRALEKQYNNTDTPMMLSPGIASEMKTVYSDSMMDIETIGGQFGSIIPQGNSHGIFENDNSAPTLSFQNNEVAVEIPFQESRPAAEGIPAIHLSDPLVNPDIQMRSVDAGHHQLFSLGGPAFWKMPFLDGWLIRQTDAGLHTTLLYTNSQPRHALAIRSMLDSADPEIGFDHSRHVGQSDAELHSHSHLLAPVGLDKDAAHLNVQNDMSDSPLVANIVESVIATSLAADEAVELPPTMKLSIWRYDIQNPYSPFNEERCRLVIPHAVLSSDMGAHFSPCGRFLAACVACMLPHEEADSGSQTDMQHDSSGAASTPACHPISAVEVMYELRIYSLEGATFGLVLASRAIRDGPCLTSIQFSPTSEHILLAYGFGHSSLLRSILIDGEDATPIYTILEVYRVSDMELVRVIPSIDENITVACFHPLVGCGLVYGTWNGELKILQYDGPDGIACTGPNFSLEEHMLEQL